MTTHFTSGSGSLFAQVNGPNTRPVWLGCHQIDDITEPLGDITNIQCPDPSGPSRYKTVGQIQGAAGAITTSVTTDVTDELDELEYVRNCSFNLYVNMIKSGRKDVFTNTARTFILLGCRLTQRSLTGLSARQSDDEDRAGQSFDISAESLVRYVSLTLTRQSLSEAQHINDISFCNDEQCRTDESVQQGVCEVGFAVTDALAGSPDGVANVLKTTDGANWTATAADPFTAAEIIIAVECFGLGAETTRVVVARGTTDGANPPEIAYSDDSGANWVNVDIGATNALFVPFQHAMFALDRNNIWVGLNNGYIYYSSDTGLTWTAQHSGTITTQAINCIRFVDENVGWAAGANNAIMRTTDGGVSWSAVTGPSAQSGVAINVVEPLDRNRAWLGYADGDLYYTTDGGVNWTARAFTGSGSGQVRDVRFLNDLIGYLAHNTSGPVGTVLVTWDGGYTWETKTTPTNVGLNALWMCSEWYMYAVGEVQGGYSYIAKGAP